MGGCTCSRTPVPRHRQDGGECLRQRASLIGHRRAHGFCKIIGTYSWIEGDRAPAAWGEGGAAAREGDLMVFVWNIFEDKKGGVAGSNHKKHPLPFVQQPPHLP